MNIELQCCGLYVLIVLLLMSFSEKSLAVTSRKLFFRTLASCIVCLSLDILSIVIIRDAVYGTFSPLITRIVCKAYVLSLILQGYEGFLYSAGEFFSADSHRGMWRFYRTWFFVGSLVVLVLPIRYFMMGRVVYSYGLSVLAAYAVILVYIASTIYMAFRGSQRSSARRRRCILLWQLSWLVAAVVQFFNPQLLVAGFAVAFGLVLVYAELENPHEGIDRLTGQFTSNALMTYVDDLCRNHKPFSAMHVLVEYRVKSVDPQTEQTVMLRIAKFLADDRNGTVFRQADNQFVVLYDTEEEMRRAHDRVVAGCAIAVDLPARLSYAMVPDGSILASADEFMRLQHYLERYAQGQDCVEADARIIQEMRDYLGIQHMIDRALEEGRVEVFYQPIYDVSKQRFTAAEALVRIRDDNGELIPPGLFIPAAEETGLIVPLGIEIFRQVCEFLSTGQAQALGLSYVEVNLSVVQFDDENPAKFVQGIMDQYHIDPSWINLEITETASNSAKKALLNNMEKLIARGVRFSLDDFGTGRSNLDYFVDMPVDIIKFDYSFTQGYFTSHKVRYVIESVTELMAGMGLSVVAEGVETEEQLKAMCDLAISYIQGFYFSRPIPQNEFLAFLNEYNAA